MSFQGSQRLYRQHDREIDTRMSLAQRRRGAGVKVMLENTIGTKLIEAANEVHRELGLGLLESVCACKNIKASQPPTAKPRHLSIVEFSQKPVIFQNHGHCRNREFYHGR